MAAGVYGINVPSNIDASMVDIYYAYHQTRNSDNTRNAVFTKLPSSILSNALYEGDENSTDNVLEGMYNLKLPLEYFNQKGFYTVYIKPKEVPAVITDISTLAAYPNIKGIVLDSNSVTDSKIRNKILTNNGLVGWRIIYIDDNSNRPDGDAREDSGAQCGATAKFQKPVFRFHSRISICVCNPIAKDDVIRLFRYANPSFI